MPDDVMRSVVLGGRYRLDARIGRGGMGDVYRAHDLREGEDVAVKVFRPEAAGAVDAKRIAREVRFIADEPHPALVSVLDASDPDSGTAYLVMELVRGADLADRLQHGALDPDHARRIVADVAEALALLHARGLVHRDVKPANILVLGEAPDAEPARAAKLADLGIAVGLDETRLTATDVVLGTAAYLSPEQVRGRPVGPASDVYALGLVLIESLTGHRAYAGGLVESAIARLHRPPALPADASPALASLLARMTAIDPAARPAAADVGAGLMALRGVMTAAELPATAPLARTAAADEAPTAELVPAGRPAIRRGPRLRVGPVAAVLAVGVVLVSGLSLLPGAPIRQADPAGPPTAASSPRTTTTPRSPASAPTVDSAGTSGRSAGGRVTLVSTATSITRIANPSTRVSEPTAPMRASKPAAPKPAAQNRAAHRAPKPAAPKHATAPHAAPHTAVGVGRPASPPRGPHRPPNGPQPH